MMASDYSVRAAVGDRFRYSHARSALESASMTTFLPGIDAALARLARAWSLLAWPLVALKAKVAHRVCPGNFTHPRLMPLSPHLVGDRIL